MPQRIMVPGMDHNGASQTQRRGTSVGQADDLAWYPARLEYRRAIDRLLPVAKARPDGQ